MNNLNARSSMIMSARLECNIKTDIQQALWNWFKLSSQCLQRWLSFAWTGRLLPYAPATCIFACMWKWRWSGDESMFYERFVSVCCRGEWWRTSRNDVGDSWGSWVWGAVWGWGTALWGEDWLGIWPRLGTLGTEEGEGRRLIVGAGGQVHTLQCKYVCSCLFFNRTFSQNCRNIELLSLNGCTKITDRCLQTFMPYYVCLV